MAEFLNQECGSKSSTFVGKRRKKKSQMSFKFGKLNSVQLLKFWAAMFSGE